MADEIVKLDNIPQATYSNQIRTGTSAAGKTSETFLFGASQVFTGVEKPGEDEIITNPTTNLKEARTKVEGVEIYNLHTQAHHCWIMIDLETGGRGWYPGSKEVVDVANALVYAQPDDTSEQLEVVSSRTFDKLDLVYGPSQETSKNIVYCMVQYGESTVGYIKNSKITATRFVDRTN